MEPHGQRTVAPQGINVRVIPMRQQNILTRSALLLLIPLVFVSFVFVSAVDRDADLSTLSDVELFLHEDKKAARAVLDERARNFSPEEMRAFQEALGAEIKRRARNPVPPTALDLLARMKDPSRAVPGQVPIVEFRKVFAASSDTEKATIRAQFMADWEDVTYPPSGDRRPGFREERSLFDMYLREAARLYTDEAAVLSMLDDRCLNRGIEGEIALFLKGLQSHEYEAGALTAARIEHCFEGWPTWGISEIGYRERGDMLPYLYHILANCGRDGLDVLVRLGKTSTDLGVDALGSIDVPEAETMLWEMYENTPANHDRRRIKLLRALSVKRGEPTVRQTRRARIREELVPYLQLPAGELNLWDIQRAVALAKDTRDPYYHSHLVALEASVRQLGENQKIVGGNNNVSLEERMETLHTSIDDAKAKLGGAEPLD
jgi:hypothetical protein